MGLTTAQPVKSREGILTGGGQSDGFRKFLSFTCDTNLQLLPSGG